tara:strand:+ start:4439 stop:5782 length:1344 start_codon:yes stop_codon:yes gene_type:complete
MSSFSIINPYTNKIIESRTNESLSEIENKLKRLNEGFQEWRFEPMEYRKTIINRLSNALNKNKDSIASVISSDMGKPITQAKKEVEKCIQCCNHFIKIAPKIEARLTEEMGLREPLGIILGIMPWNFPLWQIIRYMIPCWITGNTCLVKPAFNTVRIADILNDLVKDTRIFDTCMPTNPVTEELIQHPKIAGVSFTGSVQAGKIVGGISAQYLKPCVLELGGSDPFIVFNDADLNQAMEHAVHARFSNAGQVCIAAKRFLFDNIIFDSAVELFKEKTNEFIHYNDPSLSSTTLGPMARIDIKNNLTTQLNRANISNEQIIYEYQSNNKQGNFFPPMIIDGRSLPSNNVLYQEETFGPIAICDSFASPEEAIQKANDTVFGLGTSIWTKNKKIISDCTLNIECGTMAINSNVHSNFNVPFGGRKQSGLGLELGIEGALSFTGFKAILK